jgi:hypothetical protein
MLWSQPRGHERQQMRGTGAAVTPSYGVLVFRCRLRIEKAGGRRIFILPAWPRNLDGRITTATSQAKIQRVVRGGAAERPDLEDLQEELLTCGAHAISARGNRARAECTRDWPVGPYCRRPRDGVGCARENNRWAELVF